MTTFSDNNDDKVVLSALDFLATAKTAEPVKEVDAPEYKEEERGQRSEDLETSDRWWYCMGLDDSTCPNCSNLLKKKKKKNGDDASATV